VYESIGRAVRAVARSYVIAYSAAKGIAPLAPVTASSTSA
jgi:hypothetical protein